MKRLFTLAAIILTTMPIILMAQKLDQRKLKRDIRIMEGVLDKILAPKHSNLHFSSSPSKGIYIDGYGFVFFTQNTGDFPYIRSTTRINKEWKELEIRKRPDTIKAAKAATQHEKAQGKARQLIELMQVDEQKARIETDRLFKEQIQTFYCDYAPAINQFKKSDKIAVLAQSSGWSRRNQHGIYNTWMKISDIVDFRQKHITISEFHKRIHFDENNEQLEKLQSDIDILLEILDRAIEPRSQFNISKAHGLYLNGLGALLFINMRGSSFTFSSYGNLQVISGDDNVQYLVNEDKNTEKAEKRKQKNLENQQQYKDEIIELIADYGHTIRLPETESIILSIDMGSTIKIWPNKQQEDSHLTFILSKKDIDSYHEGRMNLADLKKNATKHATN
ncbi:hypothetical protein KAR48_20320 [bacterium]|nr:hypothetical protein [bacterium]